MLTVVAAATMLMCTAGAEAFSLGRLSVQSTLGEPLRAEVEVSNLSADEASSLKARIASAANFRAAGVDFSPMLSGAQSTLVTGRDGRAVIRVTGTRPVTEPFLDLILEFDWANGRLQRSYTLLIDPPNLPAPTPAPSTMARATPAPSAAPVPAPTPTPAARVAQVTPPERPPVPAPAPMAAPAPSPAPSAASRPSPAPRPAPAPAASNAERDVPDEYRVRRGDTLTRIADRYRPAGVSLDQMLVSLYNGNPDAFMGDNMNRLKAGVVLDLAKTADAGAIEPQEARRVIQAHATDFDAYRQRLAGGTRTVPTEGSSRQAAGTVTANVEDSKRPATESPDKLTLSRGDAAASASEAEAVSQSTERAAQTARQKELERNVAELQKLSSTAGGAASSASGDASGSTTVAQAPTGPAVTAPPAMQPAAAPAPAPEPAPAPAPAPEPTASAEVAAVPTEPASAPAEAPAPAAEPSAEAAASAAAPAPVPVAAPPTTSAEPEGGPFDELLKSPIFWPVATLLIALLAGLAFMRLRRTSTTSSNETSFLESRQPDSFFGLSGGQRVDTRDGAASSANSSLSYSLSQLDAIGDVDPVAEADVYLAYGRDLQAEEILKEALRSDPERLAIRTKLLEVYAKRMDTRSYEAQALELKRLTGAAGEEWERTKEVGREIDPENPLYLVSADALKPGVTAGLAAAGAAAATAAVVAEPPSAASTYAGPVDENGLPPLDAPLNFDMSDTPEERPVVETMAAPLTAAEASDSGYQLDIDLGAASSLTGLESTRPLSVDTALPDLDVLPADQDVPLVVTEPGALDSDVLGLDDENFQVPGPDSVATAPVDFDFGELSLDLDQPAGTPEESTIAGALTDPLDSLPPLEEGDPMARKVELADEFRRIGDLEGARELLEEVVASADGALKERAQSMLAEIG